MPDTQIFKATYSGVPVYEMMVKSVAVMRRRDDSWLNATQILKIAGFDKPQRTRVLEREVQKGVHQKVQGGYGKYQGTWIPLEKGIALAKQHNIDHLVKPLIEFQPTSSPPAAPKHINAPARPKRARESVETPMSLRSSKKGPESPTVSRSPSPLRSEDSTSSSPNNSVSATSRTPSPIRDGSLQSAEDVGMSTTLPQRTTRSRAAANSTRPKNAMSRFEVQPSQLLSEGEEQELQRIDYADKLLEYFISESTQSPSFLISPPPDFDANMVIDEDGHTALHWACAMGRIRIVKLLLTIGGDIFRTNNEGQTPLMRSVMFSNNYDIRKFPELYELLHRSTLNIDKSDRTVFHHVVELAMTKGKTHAARYYMETILNRLSEFPNELADIVNFRSKEGETALTLAARCRSKRLVKLLIDHGADPKIANDEGKSAEDYILEDERFRSSPVPPSRVGAMSYRNAQAATGHQPNGTNGVGPSSVYGFEKLPLRHSVIAQRASTTCIDDMAGMLDSLAQSFDAELQEKERDLNQAHALLNNIDGEISESQKAIDALKKQASSLDATKQRLHELEQTLNFKMGRRYQLGWEKWLQYEVLREQDYIRRGGSLLDGSAAPALSEEDQDLMELYREIPSDPMELEKECNALRAELAQQPAIRAKNFEALIKQQAEAGTGGRMPEYRRLIGAGCGVAPSEVDNVLGLLLETLESEETTSDMLWNRPQRSVTTSVG